MLKWTFTIWGLSRVTYALKLPTISCSKIYFLFYASILEQELMILKGKKNFRLNTLIFWKLRKDHAIQSMFAEKIEF